MNLYTYSQQPGRLHGGYHLSIETPNPFGIRHGGEQWAPANFQINPHHHTVWEFYYQLTGSTRWDVSGKRVDVTADSVFGVAPHKTHSLVASSSSHRFLFLAVDVAEYENAFLPLAAHLRDRPYLQFPDSHRVKGAMQHLLHELSSSEAYRDQGLTIECERFFLALQRQAIGSVEARNLPIPAAVSKSKRIIISDLSANWQLDDLARACDVSAGHLNKLFKQHLCHTVHDYILEQRMSEAMRLLKETDLPVGEIAMELGFTSSQHFSATFRQRRGVSPSSHRTKR